MASIGSAGNAHLPRKGPVYAFHALQASTELSMLDALAALRAPGPAMLPTLHALLAARPPTAAAPPAPLPDAAARAVEGFSLNPSQATAVSQAVAALLGTPPRGGMARVRNSSGSVHMPRATHPCDTNCTPCTHTHRVPRAPPPCASSTAPLAAASRPSSWPPSSPSSLPTKAPASSSLLPPTSPSTACCWASWTLAARGSCGLAHSSASTSGCCHTRSTAVRPSRPRQRPCRSSGTCWQLPRASLNGSNSGTRLCTRCTDTLHASCRVHA